MTRVNRIIICLLIFGLLPSCKKEICSAYQSSFLLNKEDQDQYFSYFVENTEEEVGTAITDIHHTGQAPNLSTDIGHNSASSPRGKEFPIQPSTKNKNGISQGPIVKNKKSKSYKKKHYILEMVDVYAEDSIASSDEDNLLQSDAFNDTTSTAGF